MATNVDLNRNAVATDIAKKAKAVFDTSQLIESSERVKALHAIVDELKASKESIIDVNQLDLEAAQNDVNSGKLSSSLYKRLDLFKGDKWDAMLQGVLDVAALPDPTGNISYASELDDDLELFRVSCPIGVLLIIFEARPEVVINIAALAIKSGNAAILKGGKESTNTASLLSKVVRKALSKTSLPADYIQTVQSREEVSSLLALDQYISLVIPRGSNELVRSIQNNTRIPVMGHADGICSIYLDESADAKKAVRIVIDAKTSYPAACNAVEILVVHESLLSTVWLEVAEKLLRADVKLLCDEPSLSALKQAPQSIVGTSTHIQPSDSSSYDIEHLSLTLSVATVSSLSSAISFINTHSSHHTDAIITESVESANTFCRGVDSAGTYVNASTRFADGFRYGFGTEVGISTGRIHARGPVGLEGLVTYKYVMRSKSEKGHIVGEFGVGEGKKSFKHEKFAIDKLPF